MRAIIILALLSRISGIAGEKPLPRFEDFHVSGRFAAKPAAARIATPRARLFQTRIRRQAMQGPNFAGYYTIATWGCGTGCKDFAVIDARTGRVYFHPKVRTVITALYQDEEKLQFRSDSRLLIVSGEIYGARGYRGEGKFYYEWSGNRFKLIGMAKIKKRGSE